MSVSGTTQRSKKDYERAARVMPGGVSSPVRAFQAVEGTPRFIARGGGARMTDVDGHRFVDFQMAFGPLILGHAHPRVVDAVREAAAEGTAFGTSTEREVRLAETVTERHPAVDWVRFVNSGTEAVMSALRLARGHTGRDLVLKFDGCYHGHADPMLVKGGSGLATFGLSSSKGVPEGTVKDTAVLPLDDDEALERFFDEHGDKLACAIVEPVPANNGLLPPRREWLHKLQALCRAHGALLIADEVITGFRLAWGGATETYGLEPDLVTLGKVIGGGLPLAAFGGRADLKDTMAPVGPVYQAGTLSGNPLAVAAGQATLDALAAETDPYGRLAERAADFGTRVRELAGKHGVPLTPVQEGSLFWLVLDELDGTPRTPAAVGGDAAKRYGRLHGHLLDEGVYLAPSAYEVGFMSLAHDAATLEDAANAFDRAFARYVEEGA